MREDVPGPGWHCAIAGASRFGSCRPPAIVSPKRRPRLGEIMKHAIRCAGLCLLTGLASPSISRAAKQYDYRYYHGDPGGSHYSKLTQINAGNVSRLKEAWRYDLGRDSPLQNTPIVVDGVLYGAAMGKVFALDAATGA